MLTKKQTGGGAYLFVTAQGTATWLDQEQAAEVVQRISEGKDTDDDPRPVSCPYTMHSCKADCAAVTISGKGGVLVWCLAINTKLAMVAD